MGVFLKSAVKAAIYREDLLKEGFKLTHHFCLIQFLIESNLIDINHLNTHLPQWLSQLRELNQLNTTLPPQKKDIKYCIGLHFFSHFSYCKVRYAKGTSAREG